MKSICSSVFSILLITFGSQVEAAECPFLRNLLKRHYVETTELGRAEVLSREGVLIRNRLESINPEAMDGMLAYGYDPGPPAGLEATTMGPVGIWKIVFYDDGLGNSSMQIKIHHQPPFENERGEFTFKQFIFHPVRYMNELFNGNPLDQVTANAIETAAKKVDEQGYTDFSASIRVDRAPLVETNFVTKITIPKTDEASLLFLAQLRELTAGPPNRRTRFTDLD